MAPLEVDPAYLPMTPPTAAPVAAPITAPLCVRDRLAQPAVLPSVMAASARAAPVLRSVMIPLVLRGVMASTTSRIREGRKASRVPNGHQTRPPQRRIRP